jgi:hypothetical protein
MKFWKWLARICSVLFIALLVVAWFANGHRAVPDAPQQNEPPPAPVFH